MLLPLAGPWFQAAILCLLLRPGIVHSAPAWHLVRYGQPSRIPLHGEVVWAARTCAQRCPLTDTNVRPATQRKHACCVTFRRTYAIAISPECIGWCSGWWHRVDDSVSAGTRRAVAVAHCVTLDATVVTLTAGVVSLAVHAGSSEDAHSTGQRSGPRFSAVPVQDGSRPRRPSCVVYVHVAPCLWLRGVCPHLIPFPALHCCTGQTEASYRR